MEPLILPLLNSFTTGINLYLTLAILGISGRFGYIKLPENLDILRNKYLIIFVVLVYVFEFLADKIPVIDTLWDFIHTFIRPLGGAILTFAAVVGFAESIPLSLLAAIIGGSISLEAHIFKTETRAGSTITTAGMGNSVLSLLEDGIVALLFYVFIQNPVISGIIVLLLIAVTFYLSFKMFKYMKTFYKRISNYNKT
ncbi:MAG: DUF4126 domain-containing protein [Candidatus Muiribacteriota bacterium]